ncbi:eukaryotic translation initiation factor 3 subunit M [Raphidocelis subcapitata]|uniref:Eukaryotic translation initiation factor 3 subunit M n=1 Tax=Raphidocelis subcapitata TaxID=307507 RepID=A0A2V0PF31_9CHLO|nr:eukaryotic translation initiation factor 3 subunit M [Raphidocelis subcapitata]|eukprot:GBF95695.1 eukaryotic translation initiation factor 3 subunit M [Raphidocelis subcapitata]
MATVRLAETYEEDSLTAVISFLQNLLSEGKAETPFASECNKLVEANRFDELITLMSSHVGLITSSAAPKDAECCLAVMAHLVKKVVSTSGEDAERAAAGKLAAALSAKVEAPELKLNGLLALYAAAKGPKAKYATLLQALRFAGANRQLALQLAPAVRGHAHEWAQQWGLADGEAHDLYMASAQLLKVVGDRTSQVEYLRLATDALALVGAGDAAGLAAAKAAALQAVKDWIAAPDNFTCDFTGLPAVAQLEKDAAGAPFTKLLAALLEGDMAAYKAAAAPAVLAGVPMTEEACLEKVRLMALLAVASRAAGGAVSLSEVQAALDIPEDQVQPWIVRAIGKRLIEGKIDQVAGTVTATRCLRRAFSSNDWAALAQRLKGLGAGLSAVAERLGVQQQAAQQQHGAAFAGGAKPAGVRA